MNETTAKLDGADYLFLAEDNASAKKIGQTIYVATSRFNGNKNWDMASALVRLIEQDMLVAVEKV